MNDSRHGPPALDSAAAAEVTRVDGPGASQSISVAPSTSPGNAAAPPLARGVPLPMPTHIGRFVIVRKLGEGGMGVVYYAFDPQLERPVALKLLRTAMHPGRPAPRHTDGEARLLREAQAMARLSHPNVVQVFEVGEFEGSVYMAMEYVAGRDLRAWLGVRTRTWREVATVFLQAGHGLAAAHAAGVVHRDFKPDNVLVGDDGRVRVLDFGLARPAQDGELEEYVPEGTPVSGRKVTLTEDGAYIGTPAYMSPEQHMRQPADARSDQFSFCVALYEGLYGRRPFPGKTAADIRLAVFRALGPPPPERKVPAHLRRLLARGLSIAAEDRYPSMHALLAVLATDPARRWRRVGLGVATLAIGAAGAFGSGWLADEQRCNHGAARLAQVWDPARADAARTAFLATGVAYAAETWPKVQAAIDAYTRTWIAYRDQFCAATHQRREASPELLDLRNACLDAGLRELDALVGTLVTADAATVEHALQAVSGLTPLARCADDTHVRERITPPGDPALAADVTRARTLLARASARREAGRPRESRGIAAAVRRSSAGLDYPPLHAEALLELGRGEEATADYELAREHLAQAYHLALGIQHDAVATDAAISLSLVFHRMGRAADAFAWSEHARSLLQRTGERPDQRVWYLLHRSFALGGLGLHVEAAAAATEALAVAEASFPPSDPRIGRMLAGVAHARWARGDADEALALFRRSQEAWRTGLSPEHPAVASAGINISSIHIERHEFAEAHAAIVPALAIMERAFGPDHPSVADALTNLGFIRAAQGHMREAVVATERAADIYLHRFGPDNPMTIAVLTDLGEQQNLLGQHQAALATLRHALTLAERQGFEPRALAVHHLRIADVLADLRRRDEAEAAYRRALRQLADDPHAGAPALRGLARLARERGDPAEAELLARSALAALAAGAPPDSDEPAAAQLELGLALLAQGRSAPAIAACEQARVLEDMFYGPDTFRSAAALLCLGRAHQARGEASEARAALTRAAEIHERNEVAPELRAGPRAALAELLIAEDPARAAELAVRAAADYADAGPAFAAESTRMAALARRAAEP